MIMNWKEGLAVLTTLTLFYGGLLSLCLKDPVGFIPGLMVALLFTVLAS